MLASPLEDDAQLRFPYHVSPKLDGIRCIIRGGVALSRNLKPIRNIFVQRMLGGRSELEGLDGELIVGSPTEPGAFGRTTSGVMSADGEPEFMFHAFDNYALPGFFADRYALLQGRLTSRLRTGARVTLVPHELVTTLDGLQEYEERILKAGFEGVMLRGANSPYKFGRSTVRENHLLKLKRFTDGEGTVVDVLEGSHNQNEATRDELGRTKRSSAKGGKVASGVVGTLVVRDLKDPKLLLRVSPGTMTAAERAHYWANQHELKGRLIKYRVFNYGMKDLPRFPTYQGIRDPDDL